VHGQPIQARRIEPSASPRGVVGCQCFPCRRPVERQLINEAVERTRYHRSRGLITWFQQGDSLAVKNLVGDGAGLIHDQPAYLDVSLQREILALVREASVE